MSSLLLSALTMVAFVAGCWSLSPPTATANTKSRVVGVLGAQGQDLSTLAALGAITVQIPLPSSKAVFEAYLAQAGQLGLDLMVSIEPRTNIQDSQQGLDNARLSSLLTPVISASATDPHFAGVLIVDDPCHRDNRGRKWRTNSAQLASAYSTVKAINKAIPVVVNFSKSSCLDEFVQGAARGTHLADIAILKVFYYKWSTNGDLIGSYATTARAAKAFDPSMKVVPKLGVYETVGREATAMPTTQWLRDRGAEMLQTGVFDGLYIFNYRPSEPVEVKTFSTVFGQSDYVTTVKGLLSAASGG